LLKALTLVVALVPRQIAHHLKFIAPADPATRRTAATSGRPSSPIRLTTFADADYAIIVDVEARRRSARPKSWRQNA